MSEALRRVALYHQDRVGKLEKKRVWTQKKIAREKAYFKDTGIPDLWNEIKDVKISNPVPDVLEGFIVTIGDLLVPHAAENLLGTGLTVYDKDETTTSWELETIVDGTEEPTQMLYRYFSRGQLKANWRSNGTNLAEIKKEIVDTFIRWLSRHITPQMLAEMDIDLEPPSRVKRSRKILQLAET